MKNLVKFYSLEGNTRLNASTIAKTINEDIIKLKTKNKILNNKFIGGIYFIEFLKNNKHELMKRSVIWIKELIE